jgi:peptidoglycan/LPS O-acetylase OafA/YrhL
LELLHLFPMTPATTPVQSAPKGKQNGFSLLQLDRRDTTVLKGLAIAAIVLHNFFHVVSPAQENEFLFHPGAFAVFLDTVRHAPLAIQAFFSFFGHYGVQIFIFLSAYGLAKSHWDDSAGWIRFMAGRIKKLYPAFGLVVLPWVAVSAFALGPLVFLRRYGAEFALMGVGLSPFLPGGGLPPVGPWWFIPFIVQFYALWLFLRWLTFKIGWRGLLAFAAVCMAVTVAANPVLARWAIDLYETPIGHMPELCLGIAAARYPIRLNAVAALLAGAIVVLGSNDAAVWPFSFIAVAIACLWAYMRLRPVLRRSWLLERLGYYSLPLFLVNGIVRIAFVPLATTPALQLLYGGVSAIVSIAVAVLMQEFLIPESRTRKLHPAQEAAPPASREWGVGSRE